jgi:hypothetical protein
MKLPEGVVKMDQVLNPIFEDFNFDINVKVNNSLDQNQLLDTNPDTNLSQFCELQDRRQTAEMDQSYQS